MAGIAVSVAHALLDAGAAAWSPNFLSGVPRSANAIAAPMPTTTIAARAIQTARRSPSCGSRTTEAAPVLGAAIALANSVAVAKRSRGSRPNALATAASTGAGTVFRSVETRGGGSTNRLAITDWGVVPVNGAAPANIS